MQVRMSAVTYLQRALLMHDLATLNGDEWEACFRNVLFPLMNKLLESGTDIDPSGLDETKMRSATLLSKVHIFLIIIFSKLKYIKHLIMYIFIKYTYFYRFSYII